MASTKGVTEICSGGAVVVEETCGSRSTSAEETMESVGSEGRVQGEPNEENLFGTKEARGMERAGGNLVRDKLGSEEGKPKSGRWGGGRKGFAAMVAGE